MDLLHSRFGDDFGDLPLFPTVDGAHVSPESMLLLVEWIAGKTGEAIVDDEGRRKFGKHSWRSTGAVYLTGVVGIEILKVQLLARWASPIITHYTRLAPFAVVGGGLQGQDGEEEGS